MKNLFFTLAFFLPSFVSFSQVSTCDVELLSMDWDEETITITLNDNNCSNSSTPGWVPSPDSVYVVQLGFSYGVTCIIPSNTMNFYPALGLNDTITYSYSDWSDPFNCVDAAFEHYQETCEATVSVVGPNNSINLDLVSNNNYIGFNPIWDNCYNTLNIQEYTRNNNYKIYSIYGNYLFETENIPWREMNGFYIIRNGNNVSKYFIE